MNSVADALNTLISGVNVAQKNGVYTLEEAHIIYNAISYLNSLQNQEPATAQAPVEEVIEAPSVTEAPRAHTDDSPQEY
jgi:hypothetical protein